MAKLVTKWRYLKPDAARHAQAYIRYIATREGVEKYVEENGARPAVQAQRVLVEKLLRDFPDARRSFEYEDYARRPTVRNASEFITRTLEEHLELFNARFNYVSYIAQRPRVQRSGAHGLFTQEEDAPDLNAAARAVSEHDGNIWTCILSLRREDAARLSYDKADAWRALLRANAAEIAARFNVPVGSFHWCGAFHNEAHHPHVHLVCYADRVQKPALTKEGVVQLRSLLARQIFRDELDAIYIRQSQSRDELRDLFSARLKEAVAGMRDAPAEMPVLESLLERLSEEVWVSPLAGKIHCGQYYQRIGKAAAGEGCIQHVVGASQNSAVHIPGQPAGTGPAAAHTKGIPASEKYRAAHCKRRLSRTGAGTGV